jgi:hypothetical protein
MFLLLALATPCRAASFTFVPGVTGVDGSFPLVEGNLPVLTGAQLVALGGPVNLYYLGYAANDSDFLYYGSTLIFSNQSTPLGTEFSLGNFAAGTVITLSLNNTAISETFFTGPAGSNPDGIVHVAIAPWTMLDGIPSGEFIGFEDLPLGVSDRDYDDVGVDVTGASFVTATTPEPPSLLLLGTALVLVGIPQYSRLARNRP